MALDTGGENLPLIFSGMCICMVVFFIILLILIKSKIKKLLSKNEISDNYRQTKLAVSEYLDQNSEIKKLAKRIAVETVSKLSQASEKTGELIKLFFKQMLQDEKISQLLIHQKINLNSAIRFELKQRLIRHPYDLRGARRCYIVETLYNDTWKNLTDEAIPIQVNEDEHSNCLENILIKLTDIFGHISGRIGTATGVIGFHVRVILFVIVISLGIWCADVFTDGMVLHSHISLMCLLDEPARYCPVIMRHFLVENVTLVDQCFLAANTTIENCTAIGCFEIWGWSIISKFNVSEKNVLVSIMAIHNILRITFYVLSLLFALIHNPIRKVYRNIRCNLTMGLPSHEVKDVKISPLMVVTRYKLNIDEAGFESIIMLTLDWANYLNVVYAILVININHGNHEVNHEEVDMLLSFDTHILSACVNIISLTLAQNKAHNTQHRYNLSGKQRLVYLAACFFNTLSYSCLFTYELSNCLHFCSKMFFRHPVGSPRYVGGFFFIGGVCLFITAGFKVIIGLLYRLMFRILMTESQHKDLLPQHDIISNIFYTAESLQLPTSNTHIQSYNSIHSISLLLRLSKQCISYIFLLSWIIWQTSYNYFKLDFNPALHPLWDKFVYISMAVIPGGWILSYLFLWIFFRLDSGFFCESHLCYVYGQCVNVSNFNPLTLLQRTKSKKEAVMELEVIRGSEVDSGETTVTLTEEPIDGEDHNDMDEGANDISGGGNDGQVGSNNMDERGNDVDAKGNEDSNVLCCNCVEGLPEESPPCCRMQPELDITGYWMDLGPDFTLF